MLSTIRNKTREKEFDTKPLQINHKFSWIDFFHMQKPIDSNMLRILSLYNNNDFKKIIIDNYDKELVIHILGDSFEYTQYTIGRIVYQIYTVNNISYAKYYDLYLKKYVLIRYINDFAMIRDFNIAKIITDLDKNLIKSVNVTNDKIVIVYKNIYISVKHITESLYFITYEDKSKMVYVESISNKIEIDCVSVFTSYDIENVDDISYNYLNVVINHDLCKINKKIIKCNEKIIFNAYRKKVNSSFENLLCINTEIVNKYTRDYIFNVYINELFENIENLKNIGIYIPIVQNITSKYFAEQFLFSKIGGLKFAIKLETKLHVYTYKDENLVKYSIDDIGRDSSSRKLTKYYENNKIVKEKESYTNTKIHDNYILMPSSNSYTTIYKSYYDNYKIIIKLVKKRNIVYEIMTLFKDSKIIFLKKGFINKNKIFINKSTKSEILLVDKEYEALNINKKISVKEKNYYSYKKIKDGKKYNFAYNFEKLDITKIINFLGLIFSTNQINITETTEENNKKTMYKCDNCGHINEKIIIDENKLISIEKNNDEKFVIGYKATLDESGKYCVTELEIPQNALIRIDSIYKKNRTNKVKVRYIGQLFDKKYYVKKEDISNCMICKEEYSSDVIPCMIIPCCHTMCQCCYSYLEKKSLCPYCSTSIEKLKKIKEITESYSFVNKKICYKVGETIEINDFDNDSSIICGNGIHYHDTVNETVKWFEFCEIPEELLNN